MAVSPDIRDRFLTPKPGKLLLKQGEAILVIDPEGIEFRAPETGPAYFKISWRMLDRYRAELEPGAHK